MAIPPPNSDQKERAIRAMEELARRYIAMERRHEAVEKAINALAKKVDAQGAVVVRLRNEIRSIKTIEYDDDGPPEDEDEDVTAGDLIVEDLHGGIDKVQRLVKDLKGFFS